MGSGQITKKKQRQVIQDNRTGLRKTKEQKLENNAKNKTKCVFRFSFHLFI